MPTIYRCGPYREQVYSDDHFPPHFHIVSAQLEVLVAISDMTILRGEQHRRKVATVIAWAKENKDVIEREWIRVDE